MFNRPVSAIVDFNCAIQTLPAFSPHHTLNGVDVFRLYCCILQHPTIMCGDDG